jgi:hypothetical protein
MIILLIDICYCSVLVFFSWKHNDDTT